MCSPFGNFAYGLASGDFAVLPEGIEIIGGMFSHVEAGMALSSAQYASRSRNFSGDLRTVTELALFVDGHLSSGRFVRSNAFLPW